MKQLLLLALVLITVIFITSVGISTTANYGKSTKSPINSESFLLAESAKCGPWNLQPDGCYERVCCCDKDGKHYCERCCPDKDGKCNVERVKC